jgi:hypothetical protein
MKELCSFEITVTTLQTIPLCGGMGSETKSRFIIRELNYKKNRYFTNCMKFNDIYSVQSIRFIKKHYICTVIY